MRKEKKQVVVIGAGPAGYVCAIRLAQLGKKVSLIEKDTVGGVCLNRGCIPSKALISAANFFEKMQHAHAIGLEFEKVKVNFSQMMLWKNKVVQQLTQGVENLLKANKVETLTGHATFQNPHTLLLQSTTESFEIEFENCVIATGSYPTPLKTLPIDQKVILDSTGALGLSAIPKSLVCFGAGYIGLELGTFYAKLGSQVTILEASEHILSSLDEDIVNVLLKRLKELKIQILTQTKVQNVTITPQGATLLTNHNTYHAEKVLLTIGRKPNIEHLGLENIALQKTTEKFIQVNRHFQTSIPHIYAIGDVAGHPMLAHKGSAEAMVAAEHIAGLNTAWDHHVIPAVMFTDPEIATVGVNAKECKNKKVEIATFPFAANGRALCLNEAQGFVKIICENSRIIGGAIIGPEASQLITELTLAIEMGAHIQDLALTIHPHPTLSEVIMEAAHVGAGHGIHIFKPKK